MLDKEFCIHTPAIVKQDADGRHWKCIRCQKSLGNQWNEPQITLSESEDSFEKSDVCKPTVIKIIGLGIDGDIERLKAYAELLAEKTTDEKFAKRIRARIADDYKEGEIVKPQVEDKLAWIPVRDRLPDFGTVVQVTLENSKGMLFIDIKRFEKQYYSEEGLWFPQTGTLEVVAWRPLPEPYKEKK